MRVTYDFHPDDLKTMRWLIERQTEILETAGATKIWPAPVDEVGSNRHLMGTCRMGNDPRTSVVDRNSRTHDVANLFLVDGSNFVTSARQQPTATIQALAYRAADFMVKAARTGEIGKG